MHVRHFQSAYGIRVSELSRTQGEGQLPKPLIACIDPRRGATWRSGYATVCKTVYSGSIPDVASINKINDLR
jgi:hypothetical protein